MSLDSYANLKLEAANWLERSGDSTITGNVATFVTLAEARINRDLRLNAVEAEATLTGTLSSRSLSLPTGYIEAVALWLTTYGDRQPLRKFIAGTEPVLVPNGIPSAWCIDGAAISLDWPCDQAHPFAFRYRGRLRLSDVVTTNALLENHPDVYLSATLIEAYLFVKDTESAATWEGRYRDGKAGANRLEMRSKRTKMAVDPGLAAIGGGGTYNINTG